VKITKVEELKFKLQKQLDSIYSKTRMLKS